MYLLKIERKQDGTSNVNLGSKYEYREFEDIKPLIRFIFENALYIISYTIRVVSDLEEKKPVIVRGGSTGGSISLSSENSFGNFN